jgi:hypothetical protein
MCESNCNVYNNKGELITEDNGGGTTPSPDITEVIVFNPNVDYKADGSSTQAPLYEDDFIILGWDSPGGDLEGRLKGSGATFEVYANRNHSASQNTAMVSINTTYDLFQNGLTGDDVLTGRISSINNITAVHYEFTIQLTGLSTNPAYLHIDYHSITSDRYTGA